ncbi:hypothetical protein B0J11DRAFT_449242 [Dendryphion nanum]|uniref:PH domain-containing protein n=1 Tax=Dendryphion nanum TaxID=256645 RepID=A0A9P9CWU3_9PLEO|nr:hypothetical protein B0J11DRAFT_449242 [Dendryphion nanum]
MIVSTTQTSSQRSNSSSTSSERIPPTYGYHNTFHTHSTLPVDAPPPTYASANSPQTLRRLEDIAQAELAGTPLPPYTCTIECAAIMGHKPELSSPFQVAQTREWSDTYVVLQGSQLSLHRIKSPGILSKNRTPGPGRLLRKFTLQHAEVGVAADFKKTPLIPKSPFAHLVPASARQKLYETDPHLFEPIREYVIRLRLETEQFLLCAPSQEQMLDWVENLCAAIDISLPLEDRSEPRYKSLPRRSRRQRALDSARFAQNVENLSNEEAGRRIIAEQERIFRQLYPHLAGDADASQTHSETTTNEQPAATSPSGDPETDDLDPDDVRIPAARRTTSHDGEADDRPRSSASTESSDDPKTRPPHRHSASQALRYRRRCAPVLLASSPRVSDVVYSGGRRMRINVKSHILVEFTSHPPRYDAHNFPRRKRQPASVSTTTVAKTVSVPVLAPAPTNLQRPTCPVRAISDDSIISFGYDLATSSSEHATNPLDDADAIRSATSSEPPSPTVTTQAKADAARRLVAIGKARSSEENARETSLSAVALGVGLLI